MCALVTMITSNAIGVDFDSDGDESDRQQALIGQQNEYSDSDRQQALDDQENVGMKDFDVLYREEIVNKDISKNNNNWMNPIRRIFCYDQSDKLADQDACENTYSWLKKICDVLVCDQSDIFVYHFLGRTLEGQELSLKDTLSLMAKRCESLDLSMASLRSSWDWRELDRSDSNKLRSRENILKCYIPRARDVDKDSLSSEADRKTSEASMFHAICSSSEKTVIVVDDIYPGNSVKEWMGGFKDFFGNLYIYRQDYAQLKSAKDIARMKDGGKRPAVRMVAKTGFFEDTNVLSALYAYAPFWKTGLAWLFVISQGNIYMLIYSLPEQQKRTESVFGEAGELI
jgi:hypothetical protein